MHEIEPFYQWRDYYKSSEDKFSPFYGKKYELFTYHSKIYNYYIHPQWDSIGSETLFVKVIYVNYEKHFAAIELIGEWNDTLNNDIMFLYRELIEPMIEKHIFYFVLIAENVFNFHGSDDSYYEEWYEQIKEENGYILLLNLLPHVIAEMRENRLSNYMNISENYSNIEWRKVKPHYFHKMADELIQKSIL